MTFTYETHLLCGMPLGYADKVVPKLQRLFGLAPAKDANIYSYCNYVTTKLPKQLAIGVSYDGYTDDKTRVKLHLTCLAPNDDDNGSFSLQDGKEWIEQFPYDAYKELLKELEIAYTEPRIYTGYTKY